MRKTALATTFKRFSFFLFAYTVCSVLFATSAQAQLKADFSASVTSGCTPLVVQFNDLSTGNPTEWSWDLGDGSTSNQSSPGKIYITPGTYTIKLRVKNGANEDSVIKTNYITVYSKPVVDFSGIPLSGCQPLNVQFTDKSNAGSGTIGNWVWDFGDGNASTDQNPTHTYTKTGSYNVSLFVTNVYGCSQTVLQSNLINVSDSVHAGFSYKYSNVCNPPSTVTFTNTSSSAVPLTYNWSFGDGNQSAVKNPTNIYTNTGTYNVQLVASNGSGCSDTALEVISIGSVQPDFTFSTSACINESIAFQDASSPVPVSGSWDFGDGATKTGINVSHTYAAAGTYTVTYTADFGGCVSSVSKQVIVTAKPTASFNSNSILTSCLPPLNVQFNNNSANAVSYQWDFGDGSTSILDAPQHVFSAGGVYTITLVAFSAGGCSDTMVRTNYVRINQPRIISFANLPFFGCAPSDVSFKANIASPDPIATYAWDFGDGSTSSAATPTHTYTNTGSYTVSLTITTVSGCSNSYTLPMAVVLNQKPTADFTAVNTNVCASDSVQFKDMSTGAIDTWVWNFGDGSPGSTVQDPIYKYVDTGYFSVRLIVASGGCRDTITKSNFIYIAPPIAKFTFSSDCSAKFTKAFTDQSIAPTAWNWNFGDGGSSTSSNPSYTYATPGTYSVRLIVANGACKDTAYAVTNIIDEHPQVSVTSTSGKYCKNESLEFNAINYNPANIQLFKWNYGDGTSSGFGSGNSKVQHKFKSAGTYNVKLITKDFNGCYDTVQIATPLIVNGPTADFINVGGTCADTLATFTDQSTSDGTYPITQWTWSYGDGTVQSFPAPPPTFQHAYTDSGAYDIQLTVLDANGCSDSLFRQAAIIIGKPVSNFQILDTIRCTATSVSFKNLSAGRSLTYSWDFGDGTSSSKQAPTHLFATEGIFTVRLAVKDQFGCKDTLIKPQSVTISNPVAQFSVSDSVANCPPLPVQVTNTSTGYESVAWDFGDGATSDLDQPFHLYTKAGTPVLQLIVKGYGNCYDTATKNIVLKGPDGSFQFTPDNGCFPVPVTFNANAVNTVSYIWDFGDGTTKVTAGSNTSYIYTSPGTFVPKLILQDASGCQVPFASIDTIFVSGIKPKFGFNAFTGCDSSLVSFTDSSTAANFDQVTKIMWDFGDGKTDNTMSPSHYYFKTGNYIVTQTITSAAGCTGAYSYLVPVSINTAPVLSVSLPDSACVNSVINGTASNGATISETLNWNWDMGNTVQLNTQNINYSYSTAGIYPVRVTVTGATTGCADTIQKSLSVLPPPLVDAGPDVSICIGNVTTLNASGAASYVWNSDPSLSCTNCASPLAAPSDTTKYYVTGSDNFGCQAKDSVLVSVIKPASLKVAVNSDSLCLGESVQLNASGTEIYNWQPAYGLSSSTIANPVAAPSVTTLYTLIGTDKLGCFSDTQYVNIVVTPLPVFDITDSIVNLNVGDSYPITSTGSPDIVSWQWDPASGLSCNKCATPTATPKSNTTYTATVKNSAGCIATDNINFVVLCNNASVFIPNTFSPNGDGKNDYFCAWGKGVQNIRNLKVFNRWGVTVFEKWNFPANTPSAGWDGTLNGTQQPTDVYVYVVDVICDNGQIITYKGNITLIR